MKKNILFRTNLLVCLIIIVGFLLTAALSYQANYSTSLTNIEQVTALTSEGIYYQVSGLFTRPVNVSLTMANDSLLMDALENETDHLDDPGYVDTIREYLDTYRKKYGFDSVFLASSASGRYYNFNGLDRVLAPDNPENWWFYTTLESSEETSLVVDNDEVEGAGNRITVFVNCKLTGLDGSILGIVGVGLNIDDLQGLLAGYENDFGVEASLLDEDGLIEISAEYSGYENVSLFQLHGYSEDVKSKILGWTEEGKAQTLWANGQDGSQCFLVCRYLPELGWHLVVERDTGALLAQMQRQLLQTLLILIAILSVILFVISYVIRNFNRRIVELTQSVEQERRTVFEEATQQMFENIYELDITHNCPANRATEDYFEALGAPIGTPYDKALHIVAEKQIKKEFQQGYINTFLPENVLRSYQEGHETLRYECMISNGGDYYWMRITGRIVRLESDNSIHMLTYRQNIDKEIRQERLMLQLAQTDEMTGFLTKTVTQRKIEALLRERPEQLYALFIFDIDNFKQANDRFGHRFGDSVILTFTKTIKQNFRQDDIIGRIGGDEFAVFLPVPSRKWAEGKARDLSAALNRVYAEDDKNWQISASIGVAFTSPQGKDYYTLYQYADAALYQTKRRGKNGYTLYQEDPQG